MNHLRPVRPPRRRLDQVAGFLGVPACAEGGVELTGLTLASSQVRPGDLFCAIRGANAHGAAFAPQALAAGAAAVLTDADGAARLSADVPRLVVARPRERLGALAAWFYGHPARDLRIAGVTGTTGKTTVAWLIEAAMAAAWSSAAVLGTVASRVGQRAQASARTTLEAPDLHAAFAAMREAGITGCAMEISSHALALHRVDGFAADIVALTNLGRDHLDFHGTVAAYHRVKAQALTPEHAAAGVVWTAAPEARTMAEGASIPILRVAPAGSDADADWAVERRGTVLVDGRPAQGFALIGREAGRDTVAGATRLVGDFNVANAALALAAAIALGIHPGVAANGIARLASVPGRMDPVAGPAGAPLALVDFAHTPEAVAAALGAVRARTAGRIIAVLGAGGGRDPGKRPLMGRAAGRASDVVIVTDDNPRDEDPAAIRAAVLAGVSKTDARVLEVGERSEAIAVAVDLAASADTVMVLGKGHESGQTVGRQTLPFDDRTALAAALEAHGPWK